MALSLIVVSASTAFFCLFLLASAATSDPVLDGINKYRTEIAGVGALTMNPGASCMAEKFLQQYENTPCTNSTGLDTIPGEEPNYPDYPSWLSECGITTDRVKDGRVLPDCVPAGVDSNSFASVAVQNYTQSANETISSPEYTSAGVASGKNWYVVVLATNTSSGDYFQQSGSLVSVWPAPIAITIAFAVLCTLLSGSII